jgi:hypothetical protein
MGKQLLFSLLLYVTACSPYEVVQLPLREADLYPLAQTRAGITVAIDEITSPERVEKFFGANLIEDEILPVNIIISNHGEQRYTIRPSDVLLLKGTEVIDPLPIDRVSEIAKRHYKLMTSKTRQRINEYFSNIALKETVLAPNEIYQGVLFFPAIKSETEDDRFFTILRLFREGSSKIRVVITDQETSSRIHFGPFSLNN